MLDMGVVIEETERESKWVKLTKGERVKSISEHACGSGNGSIVCIYYTGKCVCGHAYVYDSSLIMSESVGEDLEMRLYSM